MPDVPPYRRIADALRSRIGSGELAPGAPVPSARRISREHGVALATATKVLAALRDDGRGGGRRGGGGGCGGGGRWGSPAPTGPRPRPAPPRRTRSGRPPTCAPRT